MSKTNKVYNKKYKIMDAKINKQLKNDEIILRCIPRSGEDVTEPLKKPTTRELLIKFMKEQNEFNNEQRKHNASVNSRLNKQGKNIKTIFNILERNNIR
jgi:hypothetical protein